MKKDIVFEMYLTNFRNVRPSSYFKKLNLFVYLNFETNILS